MLRSKKSYDEAAAMGVRSEIERKEMSTVWHLVHFLLVCMLMYLRLFVSQANAEFIGIFMDTLHIFIARSNLTGGNWLADRLAQLEAIASTSANWNDIC